MSKKYTPEQHAAVKRVLALRETDYYEILLVEKKCTGVEIKKAYRKLALVMHPDKNSAPKSDEAFRRVSDAFQVLSDETQRRIYDQTGGNPKARASGGAGAGAGGFPGGGFANGFSGFGGGPRFASSPAEDLFAQFFGGQPMGGGMGGGPFQFQFRSDTDDLLSQLFGGGPSRARQRQQQQQNASNSDQGSNDQTPIALIFIAVILVLPFLLSSFFGDSSASQPSVRFDSKRPYTEKRLTPKYKIPFYVNPKDTADLSDSKLRTLGKHAENKFISAARTRCSNEYLQRQQAMQDASGWFFTDEEAYQRAKQMPLPHCDLLDEYGIRLQN